MTIDFEIPVRTASEMNQRSTRGKGDFFRRLRRKRQHRVETLVAINQQVGDLLAPPVTVRLIRIYKDGRGRMDDDNLSGSFKWIRDTLAEEMGVDDGSPLVKWEYGQQQGGRYAVKVEITERDGANLTEAG